MCDALGCVSCRNRTGWQFRFTKNKGHRHRRRDAVTASRHMSLARVSPRSDEQVLSNDDGVRLETEPLFCMPRIEPAKHP
jgi:hypothetical protein